MANGKLVTACCPRCKALVQGSPDEFAAALRCPACKTLVMFKRVLTDEEILAKGASTAADGAKKLGMFGLKLGSLAGGLLRKAADRYETHVKRSEAVKTLRERLLAHLTTEPPSDATLSHVQTQCRSLGVELEELLQDSDVDAVEGFFWRELARLSQERDARPEGAMLLEQYLKVLSQSVDNNLAIKNSLAKVRLIHEIRSGRAKTLPGVSGLVVRNSELVWCETEASLVVRERNNSSSMHPGRLFVTNLRLTFVSRTSPQELQYGDINAVEIENSLLLLTGRSRGSCAEFAVGEPDVVAEHIRYAIRTFHRQVDVGFEDATRRIAQEVKLAVWQRDGGKCIQCGATDYLEFDHVIPVAKGGANSIENVQLLCRRCNLRKSAAI